MKLKDIAELSCKILSLTVFIKFITYSNNFLTYSAQKEFNPVNISLFRLSIMPALFLLISIVLWCFAKRIASIMVKDSASFDKVINFEYHKIKPMVFSTIGVIILARAIPSFIKTLITNSINFKDISNLQYTMSIYELGFLIEDILKILIALYLIFGSKKVLSVIKSTRKLGIENNN